MWLINASINRHCSGKQASPECCVFSLIYLFPFAEKEDTDSDSGNMTFWYYSNPEAVLELYHLPVAILLLLF